MVVSRLLAGTRLTPYQILKWPRVYDALSLVWYRGNRIISYITYNYWLADRCLKNSLHIQEPIVTVVQENVHFYTSKLFNFSLTAHRFICFMGLCIFSNSVLTMCKFWNVASLIQMKKISFEIMFFTFFCVPVYFVPFLGSHSYKSCLSCVFFSNRGLTVCKFLKCI